MMAVLQPYGCRVAVGPPADRRLWFLVALAAGTVIGALAVIAAKQFVKPKAEAEANAAFASA